MEQPIHGREVEKLLIMNIYSTHEVCPTGVLSVCWHGISDRNAMCTCRNSSCRSCLSALGNQAYSL